MILVLVVRWTILDTSSHTVGSLQQAHRERVSAHFPRSWADKWYWCSAHRLFLEQQVQNLVSMHLHDPHKTLSNKPLKRFHMKRTGWEGPEDRNLHRYSFIIMSHTKVGDGNKDTDSKTINGCFSLVSKDTHKQTHTSWPSISIKGTLFFLSTKTRSSPNIPTVRFHSSYPKEHTQIIPKGSQKEGSEKWDWRMFRLLKKKKKGKK